MLDINSPICANIDLSLNIARPQQLGSCWFVSLKAEENYQKLSRQVQIDLEDND